MFGVCFAPICVTIDFDTYDGPPQHVMRFRNRSGWLVHATALLKSRDDERSADVVAVVDEYGAAHPHFMATNLLACDWSAVEPCCEYPPSPAHAAIAGAAKELLQLWLRDTYGELRALTETIEAGIGAAEANAKRVTDGGLRQIADFRRRKRMLPPNHPAHAVFDLAMIEIEAEGDAAMAALAQYRGELRSWGESQERQLLQKARGRMTLGRRTFINWHARTGHGDAREAYDDIRRSGFAARDGFVLPAMPNLSYPAFDAPRARRHRESQRSALERQAETLAAAITGSVPQRRCDRDRLRREAKAVQVALDDLRTYVDQRQPLG